MNTSWRAEHSLVFSKHLKTFHPERSLVNIWLQFDATEPNNWHRALATNLVLRLTVGWTVGSNCWLDNIGDRDQPWDWSKVQYFPQPGCLVCLTEPALFCSCCTPTITVTTPASPLPLPPLTSLQNQCNENYICKNTPLECFHRYDKEDHNLGCWRKRWTMKNRSHPLQLQLEPLWLAGF